MGRKPELVKFYDQSLSEFVQASQSRGLTPSEIARIFFQVEAHENLREPYWLQSTYEQHLTSSERIFYTELSRGKVTEISSFLFYQKIDPEIEITHWAVKYKGCGEGSAILSLF